MTKERKENIDMNINLNPKQWEVFNTEANEILFGGKKACGKSFLLQIASIWYSQAIPGLQTYLFMPDYTSLRIHHLEGGNGYKALLKDFIDNGDADISLSDMRIDFNNGSRIYLRECKSEKSLSKYAGLDMGLILIDGIEAFTEKMYSRLRIDNKTGLNIDYKATQEIFPFIKEGSFPKIIAGSNHIGVEKRWIKKHFIKANEPDRVVFIPASIKDNYHLLSSDPEYIKRIKALPENQRKMFLDN